MNLFFDTETSNLINFKARNSDPSQPWVCQLAAILDKPDHPMQTISLLIQSYGLPMSDGAFETHGISTEMADTLGVPPARALELFMEFANKCSTIIAHNKSFDLRLLAIMARRLNDVAVADVEKLKEKAQICTMMTTTKLCQLPFPSGRKGFKWPKLEELYRFLFGEDFDGAHDALNDVHATKRCYYELVKRGVLV